VAIVLAQVIGQGIATFFGTRAAAQVSADAARQVAAANAESAKRIEEIKAEAQRTFERERDRRQWRREQVAPMLQHLARMMQLVQRAAFLPGDEWQRATDLLADINQAQLSQPTRALQLASPRDLNNELSILYAREAVWHSSFSKWVAMHQLAPGRIPDIAGLDWVDDMILLRVQSGLVYRTIEDYIYEAPG
jgi:hypothetical protein